MTPEQIIEGNKLIAEFMGYEGYFLLGSSKPPSRIEIIKRYFKQHGVNPSEYWLSSQRYIPYYNSSWDWLMPVWFKIQRWYVHEYGLVTSTFEISSIGIVIKAYTAKAFHHTTLFNLSGEGNELMAMWLTCIEFIKWYNQNKQK